MQLKCISIVCKRWRRRLYQGKTWNEQGNRNVQNSRRILRLSRQYIHKYNLNIYNMNTQNTRVWLFVYLSNNRHFLDSLENPPVGRDDHCTRLVWSYTWYTSKYRYILLLVLVVVLLVLRDCLEDWNETQTRARMSCWLGTPFAGKRVASLSCGVVEATRQVGTSSFHIALLSLFLGYVWRTIKMNSKKIHTWIFTLYIHVYTTVTCAGVVN